MVNEVVIHGYARYCEKERLNVGRFHVEGEQPETCNLQTFNRIRVVPRRELFVPVVDEGFFVFLTMDGIPLIMVNNKKGGTYDDENIFYD